MVALRKESVDRNRFRSCVKVVMVQSLSARRAWIEIFSNLYDLPPTVSSLSARRAWIEMSFEQNKGLLLGVALRKESVDRNLPSGHFRADLWQVALRKESGDRNNQAGQLCHERRGRSPQGERG